MEHKKLTIYVDIDETICITPKSRNYSESKPIYEMIEKINKLYENNYIVYWTSRGIVSKNNYSELTKSQLKKWNCKYHRLETLVKPNYDILIDDKTINPLTNSEIDVDSVLKNRNVLIDKF